MPEGSVVVVDDFNSQPRVGGWATPESSSPDPRDAHPQPREGGWAATAAAERQDKLISTHSRAKAAGGEKAVINSSVRHFNSQPREGGWHDGALGASAAG